MLVFRHIANQSKVPALCLGSSFTYADVCKGGLYTDIQEATIVIRIINTIYIYGSLFCLRFIRTFVP